MERALLSLIMVWQCWLLFLIDRTWWFFIPVVAAAGAGQAVRKIQEPSWRKRARWILAVSLVVAVVVLPFRPSRAIPFWVIQGEVLIPLIRGLLLWLAVLVLRPTQRINERTIEFALVLGIFGLCMFRPAFDQQRDFYGVLAAAIGITMLVIGRPAPQRTSAYSVGAKPSRRALIPAGAHWVVIAANFVIVGTWALNGMLREVAEQIQTRVHQVAESSDQMLTNANRYLQSATLDSITEEKLRSPMQVALRVYCNVEPGYLRGRAYESFEADRWMNSSQTRRDVIKLFMESDPPQLRPLESSDPCFRIRTVASDRWRSLEVRNDPTRGKAYFSPINATYVQGDGRHAVVDLHYVLRSGPLTRAPYRFFVPNRPVRDTLSFRQTERLLAIPRTLTLEAREELSRIEPSGDSTLDKISAVETYFHTRYEYSLDTVEFPEGQDRLSHFITDGTYGHCEFFASSAVMALRLMGVPSRYVVGYAVSELEDEDGEYWVARNRDSHAWVEAYSIENEEWLVVEATPGVEVSRSIWDQSLRQFDEEETILDLNQSSGQTGGTWRWFLPNLSARSVARLSVILSAVLSIVFALVIVIRLRLRNALRSRYGNLSASRSLWKLDRRLRRRGLVRDSGETLLVFANRLRQDPSGEKWIQDAAGEYETYMSRRYSEQV